MSIHFLKGNPIKLAVLNEFKKDSRENTPACNGAYSNECLICTYCACKPSCEMTSRIIERDPADRLTFESGTRARIELTRQMEAA